MFPNLVDVAEELRKRSGQKGPAISTSKIMRACFPDTHVTGRVLPAGIHEAVSRTPEGAVLVYARGLPGPVQRFAIAHAMAHLMWDTEADACIPGRPGVELVEARADRFAEELLVPLHTLARFVRQTPSDDPDHQNFYLDHVDEISSTFKVPSEVIDRRIRKLVRLVRFDMWKPLA